MPELCFESLATVSDFAAYFSRASEEMGERILCSDRMIQESRELLEKVNALLERDRLFWARKISAPPGFIVSQTK